MATLVDLGKITLVVSQNYIYLASLGWFKKFIKQLVWRFPNESRTHLISITKTLYNRIHLYQINRRNSIIVLQEQLLKEVMFLCSGKLPVSGQNKVILQNLI